MKRRITEPSANKNANPEIILANKSIVQVNDEQPKQRTVISVSSSNNRRNRFKTLNSTHDQHGTKNNLTVEPSSSIQLSKIDIPSSSSAAAAASTLTTRASSTIPQNINKLKSNVNDDNVDKINVNINSCGGENVSIGEFNNLLVPPPPHQLIPSNLDSKSRTSCYFGIKCLSYNFNPEHRSLFAHPGDFDYKRPYFPPAPPGSPACPYGAECYRKNLDHFTQLSHPTTNTLKRNYHKSSTMSSTLKPINNLNSSSTIRSTDINHHYNNGDNKLASIDDATEIKRRKKVLVFTTEVQQDDNDDEDEDGDLFLNDINSDEYDSEEEDDCDVDGGDVEHNNFNINNYYKL